MTGLCKPLCWHAGKHRDHVGNRMDVRNILIIWETVVPVTVCALIHMLCNDTLAGGRMVVFMPM
jgi:hypothetical protein